MRSLEPQMPRTAEGMHPHHHGARGATDGSAPGENPAASNSGDSTSAAIGTPSVTTNGDSSTTTITYGTGSTVTTTTPPTMNAARGSAGNASSSFGVAPPTMNNNVLGTLIQMQAQHLTQTATTNS